MNLIMKVTTFEELKDLHIGVAGTPERDAYEAEVREAIHTYLVKNITKDRNNVNRSK